MSMTRTRAARAAALGLAFSVLALALPLEASADSGQAAPGKALPPLALPARTAGTMPTDIQAAPEPAPADAAQVVILDWHSFLGSHKSGIDFSLEEFAAQLDRLAAIGYRFVSLPDAIAGRIEGKANLVVTIDDGNHSDYDAYFKVMKPRGVVPVLFCYPAIILSRQTYALSPQRLAELAAGGCIIGAHGYHHNPLSDKAWAKDPKDFMTEVGKSGPGLAKLLGTAPTYFSYPFGVSSTRAEQALAEAGYTWAFTADDKVHTVIFSDPRLDHMAVPRTIVYRWNAAETFRALERRLTE